MSQEKISHALREQAAALEKGVGRNAESFHEFSTRVVEAFHRGNKLLLIGSGSLGTIANLIANQFLHRLDLERPLLPAVSLCHNNTLAPALNADGQGKQFFARQLRALATEGDVVLMFGGARRDDSLGEALNEARGLGCITAALLQGKEQIGEEKPDYLFSFDVPSAARAAEAALFFGDLLVELVESEIFGV